MVRLARVVAPGIPHHITVTSTVRISRLTSDSRSLTGRFTRPFWPIPNVSQTECCLWMIAKRTLRGPDSLGCMPCCSRISTNLRGS
jgi:hypothetical protein